MTFLDSSCISVAVNQRFLVLEFDFVQFRLRVAVGGNQTVCAEGVVVWNIAPVAAVRQEVSFGFLWINAGMRAFGTVVIPDTRILNQSAVWFPCPHSQPRGLQSHRPLPMAGSAECWPLTSSAVRALL